MANLDLSFIIKIICLCTVAFFGLVASQDFTEEWYPGLSDLVKSLPYDTGNYSERGHFSGYLEADNRTFLHYWFFHSRTGNWRTDPLFVWFSGGPGCTSVGIGITRFGAMTLHPENLTIKFDHPYTNYSFVEKANTLFIDTPAGVGFSYQLDPNDENVTDALTANYTYAAIKNFFFKFPHFENNTFYLGGESYASIYISLLGALLAENKYPPNFKGVLYESGFFNGTQANGATIEQGFQLGLFDQSHWARFVESCCPSSFCSVRKCFSKGDCTKTTNMSPCCYAFNILQKHSLFSIYNFEDYPERKIKRKREAVPQEIWFRNASVIEALNISKYSNPTFYECNDTVFDTKHKDNSVLKEIKILLENGIPLVLCYGDSDLITSYINALWLFDDLGDQLTTVQPHSPWIFEEQMSGYQRRFVYTNQNKTTNTSVTFFVVRHAGHMVQADQHKQFFKIYSDFIDGV